ncbi:MAG TPA: methyltransferase domain-containing protein [Rhizomicrobium sp.]|nr:methyltransferase domain-containing protein [Rhizomicrobium sp.]
MAWDPKTYLAFGQERTRPARELLARVDAVNPKRVVDLGCGPGNSTALLAARWSAAALEGVDNSKEMLEEARGSSFRATWTQADVANWNPDETYDVIFSNATLQWVGDHVRLLPAIVKHLAKDGVFAFQVPRNFDEPCHTLIHEVAQDPRWRTKLEGVRDWWNVLEPEAYFDILEPHARAIDIWETRYVQVLEGEDAVFRWMSGTGLRPYANALEGAEREAFLAEYRTRVGRAYPRRPGGVTLYPFQRLFCVART